MLSFKVMILLAYTFSTIILVCWWAIVLLRGFLMILVHIFDDFNCNNSHYLVAMPLIVMVFWLCGYFMILYYCMLTEPPEDPLIIFAGNLMTSLLFFSMWLNFLLDFFLVFTCFGHGDLLTIALTLLGLLSVDFIIACIFWFMSSSLFSLDEQNLKKLPVIFKVEEQYKCEKNG